MEQLGTSYGKLFVKGSIETVGPLLNIDEELYDQIRSSELQLKQSGLVPIILACKVVAEEELDAERVSDRAVESGAEKRPREDGNCSGNSR